MHGTHLHSVTFQHTGGQFATPVVHVGFCWKTVLLSNVRPSLSISGSFGGQDGTVLLDSRTTLWVNKHLATSADILMLVSPVSVRAAWSNSMHSRPARQRARLPACWCAHPKGGGAATTTRHTCERSRNMLEKQKIRSRMFLVRRKKKCPQGFGPSHQKVLLCLQVHRINVMLGPDANEFIACTACDRSWRVYSYPPESFCDSAPGQG